MLQMGEASTTNAVGVRAPSARGRDAGAERLAAVGRARVRLAAGGAALEHVVQLATSWVGCSMGRLSLLDDVHQHELASVGLSGPASVTRVPVRNVPSRLVVEAGTPVQIDDLASDVRSALVPGAHAAGIGSYLGVPVNLDGLVVGALAVMDGEPRRWGRRDTEALLRLGQLVEGLLGEPVGGVGAIRGALRLDGDLRVVALAGERGPAGDREIAGRHLADLAPAEVWEQISPWLERALAGEVVDFSVRWPGEERTWLARAERMTVQDGRPDGLLLVRRDAAADDDAPRPDAPAGSWALAERGLDEPLLSLLEEGVALCDAEARLVKANASARRMLGLHPEATDASVLAREHADLLVLDADGAERPAHERALARALRTRRPVLGEVVVVARPGGHRVALRTNVVPLTDAGGEVCGALVSMADVTQQQAAEAAARALAGHDPLTALPNRLTLERRLDELLVVAQATGRPLSLLALDVDGLKAVNDVHGHVHGDAYLRALADRLRSTASGASLVARIAGDEFVVVLPQADAEEAAHEAERIRSALSRPLVLAGTTHHPGCSVGHVTTCAPDRTAADALDDADLAMYAAKADGGRRVRAFSTSLRLQAAERLAVERELAGAAARGELVLRYQPIVELDGRLVALEALVRWEHPERGLLEPRSFVPIAERSPLIVELGSWVLDEACRQLAAWRDELRPPDLPAVHVNMAAAQLRDQALPDRIGALLGEHGLPPDRLAVEVTETMLLTDVVAVREVLAGISALGVRVGLDDFGTGYASLSHLVDLPIDAVKVDRSFLAAPQADVRRQELLAGVCDLGRRLGLELVAEGIETPAQVALARELGCRRLQGFLPGPPLTPAEAAARIAR